MTDRLVFLHGFTQTHHHWHAFALDLAERLRSSPTITFVDLPGHGLSTADRGSVDEAGRVAELAGSGTYIGYSMGGRFALGAALTRPDLVERLVLIGATAGVEDDRERSDRRASDDELAGHVEQVGVDAFLDEWLARPMFAGLPPDPAGLTHRRRNDAAGLAHSLRSCGTGSQTPMWSRLVELTTPTLVMAGDQDTKFTAIGQRLAAELPNGSFEPVARAGHAAHVEAPAATATAIARWVGMSGVV